MKFIIESCRQNLSFENLRENLLFKGRMYFEYYSSTDATRELLLEKYKIDFIQFDFFIRRGDVVDYGDANAPVSYRLSVPAFIHISDDSSATMSVSFTIADDLYMSILNNLIALKVYPKFNFFIDDADIVESTELYSKVKIDFTLHSVEFEL